MNNSPKTDHREIPKLGLLQLGKGYWVLLIALLLVQIISAAVLSRITKGDEFSCDAKDYQLYVADTEILFKNFQKTGIGGGFLSAPLLPYLVYAPYKVFVTIASAVGLNRQYELFLGLRFTMMFWLMLGLTFTWAVVKDAWKINASLKDNIVGFLIVFMPLNLIAPAVLVQDDCVCMGWVGICIYCWHRWGFKPLIVATVLGVWCVKPFLLFMFPALWMAYPRERIKVCAVFAVVLASLLYFFYWRDGSIELAKYAMNGSLSPTMYSIGWLLQETDLSKWQSYGELTRRLSTPILLVTLSVWCLSSWYKAHPLPSAMVGTYTVFFLSLTAVMPEYDLWFLPWTIWVMWGAAKQKNWSLFAMCWLHSFLAYAYKFFYACDSIHFSKSFRSPLEDYYNQHFNYDLKWVFISIAFAATICRIGIVYSLWKNQNSIAGEVKSER